MQKSTGMTPCRLEDIPDRSGRGFIVERDHALLSIFIVRNGSAVYAYHNVCPHKGLNLDWQKDQFMDPGGEYIHCSNHDALFRIEDGYCIAGPCRGARLRPLPVMVRQDGGIQIA
ncbi:MAG TPA: Rieske (2Fe-2S) protein [Gammaproteobacteria bacterium]|nr:Rieske (2Fe-2S) protein [Gammaproteobacteria bacterium]